MRRFAVLFSALVLSPFGAAAGTLSHQSVAFQSDAAGGVATSLSFQRARDAAVIGISGNALQLPQPVPASALRGPVVYDIGTGAIEPIRIQGGLPVNALISDFSANGRFATVLSFSPIHPDVIGDDLAHYLVDRVSGQYWLVDHLPNQPHRIANGVLAADIISDDGAYVYFQYSGDALTAVQVDRRVSVWYGFERATGNIRLIGPIPTSPEVAEQVWLAWLSANGKQLIFRSQGNLFRYDWDTQQTERLPQTMAAPMIGAFSRSGRYVFTCNQHRRPGVSTGTSVWTRIDLQTSTEIILNPDAVGEVSPEQCRGFAQISDDGSVFAFSTATAPVAGNSDSNNWQTYWWSATTGRTRLVSHAYGQETVSALGSTTLADLSSDGQTLLLYSTALDMLPGVTGRRGVRTLYRYHAPTRSLQLVAATSSNPTVAQQTGHAVLLPDGSTVFASTAELDETKRDWNLSGDLYRRNETGPAALVSQRSQAPAASVSQGITRQALSADGRWLALQTRARDFASPITDTNAQNDVFLLDTWSGERQLLTTSRDRLGYSSSGTSELVSISANGQVILIRANGLDLNADLPANGIDPQLFAVFPARNEIRAVNRRPEAQGGGFGDAGQPLLISADGNWVLVQSNRPETLLDTYQAPSSEPTSQLLWLSTNREPAKLVSHAAAPVSMGADRDVRLVAASSSLRYVLFESEARNLDPEFGIFLREPTYYLADRQSGTVQRLGRVGDVRVPVPADDRDFSLEPPTAFFSADEKQLFITHRDSNFAPPIEANSTSADCFRFDLSARTWQRLTGAGITPDTDHLCRATSRDGKQILIDRKQDLLSRAPIMQTWWRDTEQGRERRLSAFAANSFGLGLSADGSHALLATRAGDLLAGAGVFQESNLFRIDTQTGAIEWVNQRAQRIAPDLPFPPAFIHHSSDLSTISFLSYDAELAVDVLDSPGSHDSYLYRSRESANNPGLNGLWTNPADPSQGFHFLALPKTGQWLATWYTYRTEQGVSTRTDQRWLIGLGTVDQDQVEFVMTEAKQGLFAAGTTATPEPVGHLRVSVASCRQARAEYSLTLDDQVVTGTIPLNRISSDQVCTAFRTGGLPAVQAIAPNSHRLRTGHTGAWHDPRNPGQGLILEVLPDTQQTLVSWFTFDPGSPQPNAQQAPLWLLAHGTLADGVDMETFESRGGRFAQPSQSVLSPVGSISLTPVTCNQMLMRYTLNLGGVRRAGTQTLVRITPGLDCQL